MTSSRGARLAVAAGASFLAVLTSLGHAGLARATDSTPPPTDPSQAVGAALPAEQAANTDQGSSADASATQPQQSNVAIVVRINSPGNDKITQTNTISVDASSANDNATYQVEAQRPIVAAAAAAAKRSVRRSRSPIAPSRGPTAAVAAERAPQPAARGRVLLAEEARSSATTAAGAVSLPRPPTTRSHGSATRAAAPTPPHRSVAAHAPRDRLQGRAPSAAQTSVAARGVGRLLGLAGALGGGGRAAASLGLAAESGNRGPSLATLVGVLLAAALGWTMLAWAPRRPALRWMSRRG